MRYSLFLLVSALFWFYQYSNEKKTLSLALSIMSLNVALLIRPQIMYYNMVLAGALVLLGVLEKQDGKCACSTAWCLPWHTFRNYRTYGEFMYTSIQAESYFRWFGLETYALGQGTAIENANATFRDMMNEKHPDFEKLSKMEQVYAEKDIGGE